jgi:flavodoxin
MEAATMIETPGQSDHLVGRRKLLGAIASVALGTATAAAGGSSHAKAQRAGSRNLVACFTRTGNTRVIARQIGRALRADNFEIEPAAPYPEDYQETVRQAERERDSGYSPPLAAVVPDIGAYEAVFLGFPIWGETIPPVIRSFLAQHDLAGRTLVPFLTHGGYGQGQSMSAVRQLAPRARVLAPFVMQADQERRTVAQVSNWLSRVKVGA